MTTLYRAGCLEGSADIQKEREKKILKQKMLILLPFLRQLIPKIELIRNTSSSLIMLSAILRNFSTIPLFLFFISLDWKQLFQATAALVQVQHSGCSCCILHEHILIYAHRGTRACKGVEVILHPTTSTPKGWDTTRVLGKTAQDGSLWLAAVSSPAGRQRGPGSDLPNTPFVCGRSADVST